jgi:hypothetical protein
MKVSQTQIEEEIDLFESQARQSPVAASVARGTCRLLDQMGFAPVMEMPLGIGRRVDIMALGRRGEIIVVEIKSCLNDFRSDGKWKEYLDFCDRFYFAVSPDFPRDILPGHLGLIVADRFGAEIMRPALYASLAVARRKALTLQVARCIARRMHRLLDPS